MSPRGGLDDGAIYCRNSIVKTKRMRHVKDYHSFFKKLQCNRPNATVEWLAFLLRIRRPQVLISARITAIMMSVF
jgi:hypothetical protein